MRVVFISLLSIFLFSNFSWSEESGICESCSNGQNLLSNQKDLKVVAENAFNCEDQYSKEAQELYAAAYPQNMRRQSESVGNLKLSGTPEELRAMRKMLGKQPPKNWTTLAKGCDSVLCALTKVLNSEESALRALAFFKKTGYVFSIDQDSNPKGVEHVWSTQDIRTIDRAYRRLPEQFFNLPTMDIISRVPPGYRSVKSESTAAWARRRIVISGTVYAPGEIRSYDTGVGSEDVKFRFESMIHELAHHYDFSYEKKYGKPISETPEFSDLSGWKKTKKTKKTKDGIEVEEEHSHAKDHAFVRDYAGSTPTEDFAEAVAYYVMEGSYLRDLDPKKYNYIKTKVFNGVEFKEIPDGIKTLSDVEVLKNCTDKIASIEPNYTGMKIEITGQKPVTRSSTEFRFSSDVSFRGINCIPEVNLQNGGLQLCDLGKTKDIAETVYAPVFKKMGQMIDHLMKDSNFTETRKNCWQNKDFTNQCILKNIKLTGLNEEEKKIFSENVASKWNGESTFSMKGSERDLSPYLPIKKLTLACMANSFDKINGYSENSIIYKSKNSEKNNWYMYSKGTDISCSDESVEKVLDSSFKFDQKSLTISNQLKRDSNKDMQDKIMTNLAALANQCKRAFNLGINKSCVKEKITSSEFFSEYDSQEKELLNQVVDKFE